MPKTMKNEMIDRILYERIRSIQENTYQYLNQKNMTLMELSVASKLNYNALWKMMNNQPEKVNYTLKTLLILSKSLDVDVGDLMSVMKKKT